VRIISHVYKYKKATCCGHGTSMRSSRESLVKVKSAEVVYDV